MKHRIWGEITDLLECHSSTQKDEIIKFVNKHNKGKCLVHAENNIYDRWGDDSIIEYDLEKDLDKIVKDIQTHHVHNIIII